MYSVWISPGFPATRCICFRSWLRTSMPSSRLAIWINKQPQQKSGWLIAIDPPEIAWNAWQVWDRYGDFVTSWSSVYIKLDYGWVWVGVLLRFGFCSSWMRCNHITHTDTDIYEHTVLQPYQILFAKTSLDPTVDRKLKLHMNRYVWIWYWKHFKVGSPKSLVGVGKAHDVNQQNIKDWLLEEIWKWLQHKWASAKKHASDVFGHKFSKTILPNIGVL